MAKFKSVQVTLTTQVEVAVGKSEIFSYLISGVVHWKWRCFGLVMYQNGICKKLDVSSG